MTPIWKSQSEKDIESDVIDDASAHDRLESCLNSPPTNESSTQCVMNINRTPNTSAIALFLSFVIAGPSLAEITLHTDFDSASLNVAASTIEDSEVTLVPRNSWPDRVEFMILPCIMRAI